jgi:hypothetical protein
LRAICDGLDRSAVEREGDPFEIDVVRSRRFELNRQEVQGIVDRRPVELVDGRARGEQGTGPFRPGTPFLRGSHGDRRII